MPGETSEEKCAKCHREEGHACHRIRDNLYHAFVPASLIDERRQIAGYCEQCSTESETVHHLGADLCPASQPSETSKSGFYCPATQKNCEDPSCVGAVCSKLKVTYDADWEKKYHELLGKHIVLQERLIKLLLEKEG